MRPTALICLIFILISCGKPYEIVEVMNEEGLLLERYQRLIKDGAKTGPYQKFDEEGQLVEEGEYKEGIVHNKRTVYYHPGQVKFVETYKSGVFQGSYNYFYENGQLEVEGRYIDGVMSGDWKRYYTNGQLMEVVNFEQNEENGPFVEYHENGKLKAEGQYRNGDNEDGLLKLYNESGVLYKKMECDSGICKTIWALESAEVGQ